MVWFTVAQISEFSFILMALWFSLGHVTDNSVVSMVTIIGLLTIAWSSYYFTHASFIYTHLKDFLKVFERKAQTTEAQFTDTNHIYEVIVFGNHRTGKGIVDMLQKNQKQYIIVDHDPEVIKQLRAIQIPCMYGDASDINLIEQLHLNQAKMIVSTIHEYETNALIIQEAKKTDENIVLIVSARNMSDAERLYLKWANYVIVPHIISGNHTALMIETYEYDIEKYAQHKFEHYMLMQ